MKETKKETTNTELLAISFFLRSCAVGYMRNRFNREVVANAIVFIVTIKIRNSPHFVTNLLLLTLSLPRGLPLTSKIVWR